MSELDVKTITIIYVLANALSSTVMFFFWRQNRKNSPESVHWLVCFILQFAGFVLISHRDVLPDFLTIYLANVFLLVSPVALLVGLERYVGKKHLFGIYNAIVAVFLFTSFWFTFIEPDLTARVINISIGMTIFFSFIVQLSFFRVEKPLRPRLRLVGTISALIVSLNVIRIIGNTMKPETGSFFDFGLINSFFLLASMLLSLSLVFALILMVSRRLFEEIAKELAEKDVVAEELRKSKEKFSKAFMTSPNAITISRVSDGKILDVNNTFVQKSGYSLEEVLSSTTRDLKLWVHDYDRAAIVNALSHGENVSGREFLFRKKDGEILTGLFSAQTMTIDQVPCMLSSIQDITIRKKMEEDLRRSQQFLLGLVEYSDAIICVKFQDGRYKLVNEKWEDVTGFKRDYALGKTDLELFPGERGNKFRSEDLAVITSNDVRENETSFGNGAGERVFLSVKFPLHDERKEIQSICTIMTEITDRKRAERLLEEERQRLAYILEGTNVGTWEWNIQSGDVVLNERWAEIIGYRLRDITPIRMDEWDKYIHPDDIPVIQELIERHFRKEMPYFECELRMQHRDGSWVWVFERGKVVAWQEDGKPLLMCGTHQEITERKRNEEVIKHMATHDRLTDLPTLSLAQDRLAMAMAQTRRYGTLSAAVFLDLDGFKAINDTWGHDAGDRVLKEVANRLLSCIRQTDTAARIGGDEFFLILTELQGKNDAAVIAEKLLVSISRPIELAEATVTVGVSIGIALCPADGEESETLIKVADAAMYHVKNNGKNGYSFALSNKAPDAV